MAIYRRVAKRRGRAKILASTIVKLNDTVTAKLVLVRDRGKKNWLALLSTDIDLPQFEEVINAALQYVGLSKNRLRIA